MTWKKKKQRFLPQTKRNMQAAWGPQAGSKVPMEEMLINLEGDGREKSDPLNRQIRLANNMLGAQLDFIIRDLDQESGSAVASRKGAMYRKRNQFYLEHP